MNEGVEGRTEDDIKMRGRTTEMQNLTSGLHVTMFLEGGSWVTQLDDDNGEDNVKGLHMVILFERQLLSDKDYDDDDDDDDDRRGLHMATLFERQLM